MKQDREHRDTRPDRTDAAGIEPRVRRPEDIPQEPAAARDSTSARDSAPARDSTPAEATSPLPPDESAPETAERPAPGITHKPEPDAENIIPVKDEPGTL